MIRFIKGYLGKLQGNARVCIAFHPLWGIPFTVYYFYLGLYMQEFGVTDQKLGLIMAVGSAASLVFSLIAAPVVDRMGRKNATFWFDMISSALPPLLYCISGSFVMCLVAMVLFSANKMMSVAYYLVMTEDADDAQRVVAFNLFNIITVLSGVIIPITGVLVARMGLVAAERVFLGISFVCMFGLVIARHFFLKETATGEVLRGRLKGKPFQWKELWTPYATSLRFVRGNKRALYTALASVLFYVYYQVGTNNSLYFAKYFADALAIGESGISSLGAVYAAGMLVSMVLINPITQRLDLFVNMLLGGAVNIAGMLLMALAPAGSMAVAVIAVFVTALGFGVFKSLIDAALVITTEGEARSGIYSLTNLLSSGIGIFVLALCGYAYAWNPRTLYVLSSVLLGLAVICVAKAWMCGKMKGELHG